MYDDSTSPIYLYCVDKDPVFITELSKRANYLGAMFNNTDRPMFILHYNPNKSPLFIDDPNYSIAKADINGSKYFNITLKNERQRTINVYVFDHQHSPLTEPNIIVLDLAANIEQQVIDIYEVMY